MLTMLWQPWRGLILLLILSQKAIFYVGDFPEMSQWCGFRDICISQNAS